MFRIIDKDHSGEITILELKKMFSGSAITGETGISMEELQKEVNTGFDYDEIERLLHDARGQSRHFRAQKPEYGHEERHHQQQHDFEKPVEKLMKRVRTKTDQPRNPRWRVEERIKQERETWKHTGEKPEVMNNIPMTQFAVQSDHGREEHALVDIQAVQAKCRGLSAHCSAKSLLEAQRRQDQEAALKKSIEPRSIEDEAELQAFAALSWEDKVDMAQRKKLEGHVNTVFHKMSQMRGKYPKDVPDSLQNHLAAMNQGDFTWYEGDY
jgi:hypothetical protein